MNVKIYSTIALSILVFGLITAIPAAFVSVLAQGDGGSDTSGNTTSGDISGGNTTGASNTGNATVIGSQGITSEDDKDDKDDKDEY
jgi:hypothetical protein